MHIFFPSSRLGSKFLISGNEFKHLKVRRIKRGEEVGIIHNGRIYRCLLSEIKKNEALCEIVGEEEVKRPKVSVTLFQSVPQDLKTVDLIVQKLTEIGVEKLVLVLTERSFQKREPVEKRKERWRRIVREAMKQAGRPEEMEILGPVELSSLSPEEELLLALHPSEEAKSVSFLDLKRSSVGVAVGPEGGFSERDLEVLRTLGFDIFRIDTYTLRTETAAIVIAGLIVSLGGP